MNQGLALVWPEQFVDPVVLNRKYAPYLQEGRELLVHHFPSERLPLYRWFENPMPSFMLLPLFYLYLADHLAPAGISEDHRAFLPNILMAMEICAIMDDSIDQTPVRSGGPSFPARYGLSTTGPFLVHLTAWCLARHSTYPALCPLVQQLFMELGERELWEDQNRYPPHELFPEWLENRYAEVTPAIEYTFAAACDISHLPRFPAKATRLLAEIFQDVDDVVSVVEHRDRQGENNDVGMGMVTHSLLVMAARRPEYKSAVQALWAERHIDGAAPTPRALWDEIRSGLITVGIPATTDKIERDAAAAVTCCPAEQRPHMTRIVQLFLRRLERSINPLGASI